ncbi:MAG: hypothetical protein V1711_02830 [bacterium]
MENNKADCGCAKCGIHGMCGQHHWMHLIIKIVIAIFIFWCGVQFGELKGILHGGGYSDFRMVGFHGIGYRDAGDSQFTIYKGTQKTTTKLEGATTTVSS